MWTRAHRTRHDAPLKGTVSAHAVDEIARWLERADPPRSERRTPLLPVVGAIARHLRVGGAWRALPPGCAFAPRCARADAACAEAQPAMRAAGQDHEAACFHLPAAAAAGAAYAAGGLGLYRAFGIGPVRLAAPLCGSYPVLSLAFAVAEGGRVPLSDWLAVLAVIAGLALAASGAPEEGQGGSRPRAVLWSLLASAGFALTFFAFPFSCTANPASDSTSHRPSAAQR